jgi:hypothetical protein
MSGSSLVPLYYLSGIGVAVGGGVAGVRSYLGRQREKWVQEGAKEADLAKVLEANSRVGAGNTEAIDRMSVELRRVGEDLRAFTSEASRRLDAVDRRFDTADQRTQAIEDALWGQRGRLPDRGIPGQPDHM